MRKVLLNVEQTPEMADVLRTAIPELPVSHFDQPQLPGITLGPDGRLPNRPPILEVGADDGSFWSQAHSQFDRNWQPVIRKLQDGNQPSLNELRLLRQQLGALELAAGERLAGASGISRSLGQEYVASLRQLVLMAEMPVDQSPLARKFTMTGFPGGTVADLLAYCFRNKLSLEYGSTAQLAVASAVRELTASMEYQLARAEERIEAYKAQNPAHNAVLRARLLGVQEINGITGGLNSPAYGRPSPAAERPQIPQAARKQQAGRAGTELTQAH